MTSDQKPPKERTSKYWICNDCAEKKGWKAPEWAVTCTSGLCGWCDSPLEESLTPTVDFSGPGKKAIWD
jgi:hypothetical protein